MVTHDFPKEEEEIQEHAIHRKNHGYSLLRLKGYILVKFLPKGSTANCDHYTETLRSHLPSSSSSHTKNVSSVAPQWYEATHNCAPFRSSQNFSVLPHPPYGSDLIPSDFHLLDPLNTAHVDIIMWIMRYCTTLCVSGCKGQQLLQGRNTNSCSKVRDKCWQKWSLNWKITMPSEMLLWGSVKL